MNRCTNGDEEGEYIFTVGGGETVIGYVIRDIKTWADVKEQKVGENIRSDHHPIIIKISKGEKKEKEGVEKKEGKRVMD